MLEQETPCSASLIDCSPHPQPHPEGVAPNVRFPGVF